MSNKTDIVVEVGKHKFELAGLGLAPFRFVGLTDNVITYPDGTSKAGSSCDYCGTGIRSECWILSADGKRSKVGCNCIEKVGDKGLLRAFKNSPEFRSAKRAKEQAKATTVFENLRALIADNTEQLRALPHPRQFVDRKTGRPLTFLDQVEWLFQNSGRSGRARLLVALKKTLDGSKGQ